ncbi:hypothetical protein KIW84_070685 [Lathyrus oleraceus]|uniref:Uncharacterized protein n=1 Tax=Pisum sativum TaxID=3888 RepID=A0A9D4VIG6_PEA|nr:hypothetical protein KIW84_070685 [Pisum sativum]
MAIASANVISIVATYVVPSGEWPELFSSLLHSSRGPQEDQRELCLVSREEDVAIIAFEVFDELTESFAPLLGDSVTSTIPFSLKVCSAQGFEHALCPLLAESANKGEYDDLAPEEVAP